MDEARFGRINRPVACWAPAKVRPTVDCQVVREYLYAYSAICPQDGGLISLVLPTMQTECFARFLEEVSVRHPDELNIHVCDGAASHTTAHPQLPENVQILTLPPYSPELNPTEQLWDLIGVRRFSNQIYRSLDDVEHALLAELRALESQPATIATLTARAWITQATNMNAT